MTSNTNKELYEWAWDQYHKGEQIDILLRELNRYLNARKLYESGELLLPVGGTVSSTLSVSVVHIPLLIEALENYR